MSYICVAKMAQQMCPLLAFIQRCCLVLAQQKWETSGSFFPILRYLIHDGFDSNKCRTIQDSLPIHTAIMLYDLKQFCCDLTVRESAIVKTK